MKIEIDPAHTQLFIKNLDRTVLSAKVNLQSAEVKREALSLEEAAIMAVKRAAQGISIKFNISSDCVFESAAEREFYLGMVVERLKREGLRGLADNKLIGMN